MGRSSCGAGVKGRAWRSRKRRCRAGRCSPNANDRGVRTERSARRTTHSVEGAYGTLLVGVYSFMHNSARGLARGDSHAFDRKRSAKPVWACGWSSQTRRRRPEESVQTDQHDLRGQCDLRGSAALVRRCAASPRFSLLRPRNAFDSTARVARSARRAGHLVQQPGCTPRPRQRDLHEGLDQHGVDQRTGHCRCPTTMAGLPHTGFAERLPLTFEPLRPFEVGRSAGGREGTWCRWLG